MIEFISKYYQIISVIFGILATIGVIVGIAYKFTIIYQNNKRDKLKYRTNFESKLNDLEKRLFALDRPDGRINKLSDLCQSQIKSNKLALSNAAYVKGVIDGMKG